MATEGSKEIMLFGVRITVDSMRKTASMNNLSDYQHVAESGKGPEAEKPDGYVSDNGGRVGVRERKRGTPWSEEEHKRFLMGLKKVGKGDWRGISKNFVKTRTPTQVASHAQKYFLRHSTVKRRRRNSLFDITTETVSGKPTEEQREATHGDSGSNSPTADSSKAVVYPIVPSGPTQMPPPLIAAPISFIYPPQVTQNPMMMILPAPPLALQPVPLNLSLSLSSHSQTSTNPGLVSKDSYISVA
uniref:Uncharacterized protein n=1 Tax=Kalanchoe fedtschenkoi TaxID=63787 RepID=A0A7N0VLR1_KALFE